MADDNAAPLQAPEEPLTVAYYVTGHGLGHATRAADVVGELCRRGHSVVVVSAAPQHVFVAEAAGAPGALSFRKRLLDCGAKQADALSVDPSGSLELYHATAVEPRETLLREEEAWLLEARVSIVVTDIVPLACAAAARAGLPCVGCSNFSWDFVYADYFVEEARSDALRRVVWQIAEDYSHADALLRLPGHTPLPAFREIVDVPLVVRRPRRSRAETRASLGVAEDTRLLLYQFGGHDLPEAGGDWLPAGWFCVVASTSKSGAPLPPNWARAPPDAFVPDLVAAADVILGKIGYGTASESLACGVPLVFVRRDHFNEEPFLRRYLEVHECAVEMARRDFFAGHWRPALERASQLRPCYTAPTNGAAVAAAEISRRGREPRRARGDAEGASRLRDAVVFGLQLLRARDSVVAVPEWYTNGATPAKPAALGRTPSARRVLGRTRAPPWAAAFGSGAKDGAREMVVEAGDDLGLPDTRAFIGLLGELGTFELDKSWRGRRGSVNATYSVEAGAPPELKAAAKLFAWSEPLLVCRAPGRLDVFGGMADYAGSLVIGLPTAEACHVAVQRTAVGAAPLWRHMLERQPDGGRVATLRVVSLRADATNRAPTFDINLAELRADGAPISYEAANALFDDDAARGRVGQPRRRGPARGPRGRPPGGGARHLVPRQGEYH